MVDGLHGGPPPGDHHAMPPGDVEPLLDADDATMHAVHEGHSNKAYVAILFMFVMLTMGAFCRTQLAGTSVPYTLVLLLVGLLVGMVSHWLALGYLEDSIDQWASIDPHLLLFAFLPGLVFESSFNLEWHTLSKCLGQVMVLAGPGVVIGMGLLGAFCKIVLPYGWSWNFSLTVGAVLCATDPVAVVALLRDLGASKKLSTVIEGESLFNDGTAIVVFKLFFELAKGATYNATEVVVFFLQVPLGGVAVGLAAALGTLYWLGHTFNDAMVDISLTVTSCYLTFFVAEEVCEASGVLAVVTLGAYLGAVGKPFFQVRKEIEETLHHFWEMTSYISNTIIFILAGVIIGRMLVRQGSSFTGADVGWLLLFYVWLNVSRVIMVALLFPLLRKLGYGLDVRNAAVMCWGGLRGAVGLALALVISLEKHFSEHDRARVMFLTGGVVVLTLVINGSTTGMLLNYLGLNSGSANKEKALKSLKYELRDEVMKKYLEVFLDETLGAASYDMVRDYVSALDSMTPSASVAELAGAHSSVSQKKLGGSKMGRQSTMNRLFGNVMGHDELEAHAGDSIHRQRLAVIPTKEELIADVRGRFLQTVKHEYTVLLETGLLEMRTSLTLLGSADSALDRTHDPLCDWEMLQAEFDSAGLWVGMKRIWVGVKWVVQLLPARAQSYAQSYMSKSTVAIQETNLQAAVAFVTAHRTAQEHIQKAFKTSATDKPSAILKAVVKESKDQSDLANLYINEVKLCFPEIATLIKSKEVTRELLYLQITLLNKAAHEGIFEEAEIGKLMSKAEHDLKMFLYSAPSTQDLDPNKALLDVPLIKSLVETDPRQALDITHKAVKMSFVPGNLVIRPESTEDRVILLGRGVVTLEVKDRENGGGLEHKPVTTKIGSRSHPGGWIMGLDDVLLKEDDGGDPPTKRCITTVRATTIVVGWSLPGALVRKLAAREKEGQILWLAAAAMMLETTLRNELNIPLTTHLQERLKRSKVQRLPATLEVSDEALYILVQGAVESTEWGTVYAPVLLSHNTENAMRLAILEKGAGGHIHFTSTGKIRSTKDAEGTTDSPQRDTRQTFKLLTAGRYIKIALDARMAVEEPESPAAERAYPRTMTHQELKTLRNHERSRVTQEARRLSPFDSDPPEEERQRGASAECALTMRRVPSMVAEESEPAVRRSSSVEVPAEPTLAAAELHVGSASAADMVVRVLSSSSSGVRRTRSELPAASLAPRRHASAENNV